MMLGKTELTITHETLVAALQYYLSERTFADGKCPRVLRIAQVNQYSTDDGFKVETDEPSV